MGGSGIRKMPRWGNYLALWLRCKGRDIKWGAEFSFLWNKAVLKDVEFWNTTRLSFPVLQKLGRWLKSMWLQKGSGFWQLLTYAVHTDLFFSGFQDNPETVTFLYSSPVFKMHPASASSTNKILFPCSHASK